MSNYTKTTNFTAKDSLPSGNPSKIILGSEHDTEYNAIATAIASKADSASPIFTGTIFANFIVGSSLFFQNTTTNAGSVVQVKPNGTGNYSGFAAFSSSDHLNSGYVYLDHFSNEGRILTQQTGTGTAGAIYIGPNGVRTATFNTTGNVGIGVTTPNGRLHISDATNRTEATAQFTISGSGYAAAHYLDATGYYIRHNSASRQIRVIADTGGVSLAAAATAWAAISDETKKDIIEPITNATHKLSTVRAVIGKYKEDDEGTRRSFLIAQDIQAVLPEAVDTDAEGILSLRYTEVLPLLVAAIKEQQGMIEDLKARVHALGG